MMARSGGSVSLYSILNVPVDAPAQTIRKAIAAAEEKGTVPVAYLRMAKEILLNPAERAVYDEKLNAREAAAVSGADHAPAGERRRRRFSLLRVSFLLAIALVLWWSLTVYYGHDPGKVVRTAINRFDPAYLEMIGHTDDLDKPGIYKKDVLKDSAALARITALEHDALIWFPEKAALSYMGKAYILPMAASGDFRRFALAGSFGQLYVFRPPSAASQLRRLSLEQVMWDQHTDRWPLSLALSADGDTAAMAVMEERELDMEELRHRGVIATRQHGAVTGASGISPEIKKWKGIVGYWDIAGSRKLQNSVYTAPGRIVAEGGSAGWPLLGYQVLPVQTQVLALNDSMFLFGAQGADIWTSRFAWKKYRDDLKVGLLSASETPESGENMPENDGKISKPVYVRPHVAEMQYAPAAKLALASLRGGKNGTQTGLLLWEIATPADGWFSWPLQERKVIPSRSRLDLQDGAIRAFRVSADGARVAILGENHRLHLYRLPDFLPLRTVTLPKNVIARSDLMLVDVAEDGVALLAVTEEERDARQRRLDVAHFIWREEGGIEEVDAFCAQRIGLPAEGYFGYVACDNSALHVLPARPDSGKPVYYVDLPIRFN